jgi:hypothetical protein
LTAIAAAGVPWILASCESDEERTRTRIAGDYAIEFDGRPKTPVYGRQVLTLRLDGKWVRTSMSEVRGVRTESPPDSGTFRIQGVTLVMRSLVYPAEPMRYTIGGDTLFNANAAMLKARTGYDIGEQALVRVR